MLLEVPQWLWMIKYIISNVISIVAVPGFFIIASILLYRKPFGWKENVKKKIRTLIVPYFILNTMWILIFLICQSIPFLKIYFGREESLVVNWTWVQWSNPIWR